MKSKKKIAFLIPAMHSGGMERVMSQLLHYISTKKNIQAHLIIYGKNSEIFYDIPETIIIHRPEFTFNDRYRKLNTLRTIRYLRNEIKTINPSSILSFGELWNNLVLIALMGLKYPVFISDRCKPDKTFRFFQNSLRKLLYPRATGMIAQTERAKEIYQRRKLNKNIIVIGNPIREIKDKKDNTKENVVISVGRLISTKHFDRLIGVFARINKPDWKLIIVGGDAIKQKNSVTLQHQINQSGLQNKVLLEGNQKDIEGYLLRSKIFAFASSSEGFPNVIGEAMSAGLPVVTYDCVAGPSDMIADGRNGYLIPLFDDLMFEEKLRYLMENEEERQRMGVYARESIQRFSVETIGGQYYEFLMNTD